MKCNLCCVWTIILFLIEGGYYNWVFVKAPPDSSIWVCGFYLGGDHRSHSNRTGKWEKDNYPSEIVKKLFIPVGNWGSISLGTL